jgi:hypothetical protein
MLIGAEGARLLREYGAGEAPRNARGCSLLERKSTGKFNSAQKIKSANVYFFIHLRFFILKT